MQGALSHGNRGSPRRLHGDRGFPLVVFNVPILLLLIFLVWSLSPLLPAVRQHPPTWQAACARVSAADALLRRSLISIPASDPDASELHA
ncbi:MAG: hypothetical protein SGPRY_013794, partial [Prymnesium sp.]